MSQEVVLAALQLVSEERKRRDRKREGSREGEYLRGNSPWKTYFFFFKDMNQLYNGGWEMS